MGENRLIFDEKLREKFAEFNKMCYLCSINMT